MKYIDEFRDGDGARHIAANIAAEVRRDVAYNFMEFCGGHTHAISRYGIADMLPANVRMIHGPGCPVCVLPIGRVDLAGVRKEVSIDLVDDAQVGDYVIIHVGYAIGKIDPEEAQRTLALFAELAQSEAQP